MNLPNETDQYSEQEARKRLKSALRGARAVGPMHKLSVTPKRPKAQPKRERKRATGPKSA